MTATTSAWIAAALGIGGVGVLVGLAVRAVLRAARGPVQDLPVGTIPVPDSVWDQHGQPAEDEDQTRELYRYCAGCRAVMFGLLFEATGAFLCWAKGHITEEENPYA